MTNSEISYLDMAAEFWYLNGDNTMSKFPSGPKNARYSFCMATFTDENIKVWKNKAFFGVGAISKMIITWFAGRVIVFRLKDTLRWIARNCILIWVLCQSLCVCACVCVWALASSQSVRATGLTSGFSTFQPKLRRKSRRWSI